MVHAFLSNLLQHVFATIMENMEYVRSHDSERCYSLKCRSKQNKTRMKHIFAEQVMNVFLNKLSCMNKQVVIIADSVNHSKRNTDEEVICSRHEHINSKLIALTEFY